MSYTVATRKYTTRQDCEDWRNPEPFPKETANFPDPCCFTPRYHKEKNWFWPHVPTTDPDCNVRAECVHHQPSIRACRRLKKLGKPYPQTLDFCIAIFRFRTQSRRFNNISIISTVHVTSPESLCSAVSSFSKVQIHASSVFLLLASRFCWWVVSRVSLPKNSHFRR